MNLSESGLSRNFLIIWFGQLISSIGSGLTAFALGIFIYRETGTATGYSLIILCAFLPAFILRPFGGTLSDRFDRRLMMMTGDLGSAAGLIFILIMMYLGNYNLWIIYSGIIISSVFVALQNPAYKASVTDLLGENAYSKASGLIQLAESSKFLLSPVIAGFLLTVWDIKSILILDIFTFVVAVIAVFLIKQSEGKTKSGESSTKFFEDLSEGFKYTFSNRGLVILLLITSLITLSVGFLQALFAPMVLSFTDAKTLGIMQTVSATGMLISSFLIGAFSKIKKQLKVLSFSLGIAGTFYALMGISINIVFVVGAGFLFFCSLPFINSSLDVLIRKNADNKIQGRVWSIVSFISQSGMLISFVTAGLFADYIFNPMFKKGGILASSAGKIIGTGEGRGIGFMFIISGLFLVIIAAMTGRIEKIKEMDRQN